MTKLYILFLTFVLFPLACNAGGAKPDTDAGALLKKAQALVDKASAATCSRASAVPLYDEPLRLLTEIATRFPQAREENAQAEKLKALCYDRQARYAEKHQALKRYADLASGGDKEKAAKRLSAEADALLKSGETPEGILLCQVVSRKYPDTEAAPRSAFKRAKAIGEDKVKLGPAREAAYISESDAIAEYKAFLEKYPNDEHASDAYVAMVVLREQHIGPNKAVDALKTLVEDFPDGEYAEAVFLRLSELLDRKEDGEQRITTMRTYLEWYPQGKHSALFRGLLGGMAGGK